MIRFSLHGPPPRGVRGDAVHGIVSRNTLYGMHRPIMRPDLDVHCSKTTLLFFTNRATANMFASRFLHKNPDLRRPWRLESMPFEDLQKICLLNYLDTYLCFHVSQAAISDSDASSSSEEDCAPAGTRGALLDCYEYKSAEYPSRQILNMIMENLWQQN